MHETCEEVGLPAEPEGPATMISILGMELDTEVLEIRLPPAKLERRRSELGQLRGEKAYEKRDLLSLIGVLSHAFGDSLTCLQLQNTLTTLFDLAGMLRQISSGGTSSVQGGMVSP